MAFIELQSQLGRVVVNTNHINYFIKDGTDETTYTRVFMNGSPTNIIVEMSVDDIWERIKAAEKYFQ